MSSITNTMPASPTGFCATGYNKMATASRWVKEGATQTASSLGSLASRMWAAISSAFSWMGAHIKNGAYAMKNMAVTLKDQISALPTETKVMGMLAIGATALATAFCFKSCKKTDEKVETKTATVEETTKTTSDGSGTVETKETKAETTASTASTTAKPESSPRKKNAA